MNRRAFLTKLSIGIVATAALAKVPASVIKRSEWLAQAGKRWATERLYKAWHGFYRRKGKPPYYLRVSQNLHDLYESELSVVERFVFSSDGTSGIFSHEGRNFLAFKGSLVVVSRSLIGYQLYAEGYV